MFDPIFPVLDNTCVANPVLGIPRTDRVEMGKGMFQGRKSARKTYGVVSLPISEEIL